MAQHNGGSQQAIATAVETILALQQQFDFLQEVESTPPLRCLINVMHLS